MSKVSTEIGDADITKFGDSTEFVSQPLKRPKTDLVAKVEAVAETEIEVPPEIRGTIDRKAKVVVELEAEIGVEIPRKFRTDRDGPDYWRQRDMFLEQYESSEGYEVEWEKLEYDFAPIKFEWGGRFDVELSNKELLELLIKTAIDEVNEDYGGEYEFVKYVSANVTAAQGFCFYITLLAKDLSEPNTEPKLYRTLVRKFRDEIDVVEFKPRPTQQVKIQE